MGRLTIWPALFVFCGMAACTGRPSLVDGGGPSANDNRLVENRGAGKDEWWDALPRSEWAGFERVPIDDDWFEVYRVAEGLYAIYEPGQFEEVISFLITGSERALLFDTGLGIGNIRAVVESLTRLDVTVLNSHTHYDHIGGNHQFARVLALDTAFTRASEAGGRHEDVAEFVGPGWIWKDLPAGFDASEYRIRPFSVTRRVSDGDSIDLGGRVLEVLATPGHAPDAVCLFDRGNRLLFTGDSFYLAPLYAHLPGSDLEQYAASATRLALLGPQVDWLLTSHNVPVASARYLAKLDAAFGEILSGSGNYSLADGDREYVFEDFSVIVGD